MIDEFPTFLPVIRNEHQQASIAGIFLNNFNSYQNEWIQSYCDTVIYLADFEEIELKAHELLAKENFDLLVAPKEAAIIFGANLRATYKIFKGQSIRSALLFRDKLLMKTAVAEAGLAVPRFENLFSSTSGYEFIASNSFPIVVKPTRGCACKNVQILHSIEDWQLWLESEGSSLNDGTNLGQFEIEEYVSGDIYHIDGLLHQGKLLCMWPSLYITPCANVSFTNFDGSYLISPDHPLFERLRTFTHNCLIALQESSSEQLSSAFHVELFHDREHDRIVFCEAASRVSGSGCRVSDNWEKAFGVNLTNENIRCQVTSKPLLEPFQMSWPGKLYGSIYIPVKLGFVASLPLSCDIDGIVDYTAFYRPGDSILAETENSGFGLKKKLVFAFIEAESEFSMKELLEQFRNWFYTATSIEPISVSHGVADEHEVDLTQVQKSIDSIVPLSQNVGIESLPSCHESRKEISKLRGEIE